MIWFEGFVLVVSILAGSVAALSGFGIGSLLTPLFAVQHPLKVAVAAVAIPHLIATTVRFWMLREHVDRKLLLGFGLTSAAGGLIGALLYRWASSPALTIVFAAALLLAAGLDLTGAARRIRLHGAAAWIAGAASGLLGGMVGNQGGIRSAALLGFETTPRSFVATATAVALIVDLARMPVYVVNQGAALGDLVPVIALAAVGALIGTFVGKGLLIRLPERVYRKSVSVLILALGVYMMLRGITAL